jgi:Secretion system C-terminal sorting domain
LPGLSFNPMKSLTTFLLFFTVIALSFSQTQDEKRDNIWLFGYGTPDSEPPFGWTTLDFSNNPPDIIYQHRYIPLFQENASICDKNGNLLFYTNGIKIGNADNQLMVNGGGLNPGIWTGEYPDGLPMSQGALALPVPGSDSLYVLIHGLLDVWVNASGQSDIGMTRLYYSLIDMSKANGKGAVVEKNVEILADTLVKGKITAVRHGNGRDWWIVIPEHNTNCYYRFLLTPDGLLDPQKQCVGNPVKRGLGQAVFSPDGEKYARNDLIGGLFGVDWLNIYDIDRCTGLLSNQYQIAYADSALSGGVAFSPNSRFLYVPHYRFVFQFDLQAQDIPASKDTVAVYDGFTAPAPPFYTLFYLAQLAPDGKIYICSPNGSNYLHVINNPDLKGDSCDLVQHGVELLGYSLTMPNFANFRLGKWEDSPCDTIIVTSIKPAFPFPEVAVYPNPASGFLMVEHPGTTGKDLHFSLFDATGRPVVREKLTPQTLSLRIDLTGLAPGLYYYRIEEEGRTVKAGKVMVVRRD